MAEYCHPDIRTSRIITRFSELAANPEAAEIVPDDISESEELITADLLGYMQLLIKQEADFLLGLILDEDVDDEAAEFQADDPEFSFAEEFEDTKAGRTEFTAEFAKDVADFCEKYRNNPSAAQRRRSKATQRHPNARFRIGLITITNRYPRIKTWEKLNRVLEIAKNNGTLKEKYKAISKAVLQQCVEARERRRPLHDRDLQIWAREKATELGISFKASSKWLLTFKRTYKITSRKVTNLTTVQQDRNQAAIDASAESFRSEFLEDRVHNYRPDQIFNTDQSGYTYELHSTRTLSWAGEK